MTPQEESMLNDLVGRVEQTQLTEKDPEAEQLLVQRLGRNPNALYILAQTVLVQKYALEQATAQINQLRQQAQAPPPARPRHQLPGQPAGAPRSRSTAAPTARLHPRRVTARLLRSPMLSPGRRCPRTGRLRRLPRRRLKLPAHGRHDRRWCGCGSTWRFRG